MRLLERPERLALQDKQKKKIVLAIFYRLAQDGNIVIFLQKRTEFQWEFPGGKVELNETLVDALQRELHEEVGLEIHASELEPFRCFTYEYHDKIVDLHCFLISIDILRFKMDRGHWFSLLEVAQSQFPLIEGSRSIVDSLKRKFYV